MTTDLNPAMLENMIQRTLWAVRCLRQDHAELTIDTVYAYLQQGTIPLSRQNIGIALTEVEKRGLHWNKYYDGIPDACIMVKPPTEV